MSLNCLHMCIHLLPVYDFYISYRVCCNNLPRPYSLIKSYNLNILLSSFEPGEKKETLFSYPIVSPEIVGIDPKALLSMDGTFLILVTFISTHICIGKNHFLKEVLRER